MSSKDEVVDDLRNQVGVIVALVNKGDHEGAELALNEAVNLCVNPDAGLPEGSPERAEIMHQLDVLRVQRNKGFNDRGFFDKVIASMHRNLDDVATAGSMTMRDITAPVAAVGSVVKGVGRAAGAASKVSPLLVVGGVLGALALAAGGYFVVRKFALGV